jgi:iron complex outermembrane receptor protein
MFREAMMTNNTTLSLRALLLLGAAFGPAVAYADQPTDQPVSAAASAAGQDNGEIVVTARFRNESVRSVPIAITAVTGATLDEHAIHNLQDLSATVPTIDFRNGASNKDRTVFIRGIGTISTSPGVEPSVSTVLDGVVLSRPGQATVDVGEIERIEVLRGPQGTLFGKNASAGVINIVTAAPSEQFHAYGEATATTDQEYRAKAGVTGALAPNLTARIDGLYTHYNGNVTNEPTGNKVNGFERYGARGKLQFTPTANLKLTLSGDYLQSHDTVPTGVFTSTTQSAFPTRAVTNNTALASYFSGLGLGLGPDNRIATSNFDSDVHDKNYGTSLTGELKLDSGYSITSITAWRGWKNHQDQDYDQIATLTPALYQGVDHGDLSAHQVSQELRLTSPKGHLFDYVLGAYYLRAVDDERYQRDITKLNGSVITPYDGVANYGTRGNNYALFGEANINFTDKLRAIAGYRSSWDKLSYYHQRISSNDPGNTGAAALDVTGIRAYHASNGSTSTRGDTARAGLQYDFAPANQVYFTWSRGYKGPAYDAYFNMRSLNGQPLDEIALAPETSNSFEVGAKGATLDHKLTYALAVYSTTFNNYQANYNDIVDGAQVTRLINAGRVGTKGVELDIGLHPVHGLSFDTSVAYDDAKVQQFNCPVGAPSSCLINGQPLPFAPRWKLYQNIAYRFAVVPGADLELQTDVELKSATQYQLTETPSTIQPAYAIWNASVAIIGKEGWQLRAYVKNLTNTHYSDYLSNGTIGGTVRFVPRDDDRYAGFVVRKDF